MIVPAELDIEKGEFTALMPSILQSKMQDQSEIRAVLEVSLDGQRFLVPARDEGDPMTFALLTAEDHHAQEAASMNGELHS